MMTLTAPLPLTGQEKKIAPAARTVLTGVAERIVGEVGAIKTPMALTSFWSSLRTYAARNHAAVSNGSGTAKPTPAPAKIQPAKAAARPKPVAKPVQTASRSRSSGAA